MAGRNINNLRYADDTTLLADSKEELKSLLMKVREESISSPIISWLQSQSTMILEPQKMKSVTASTFPASICHKVMDWMP